MQARLWPNESSEKWAKEYHQRHPEVVIEYEGLSRGEGESLFLAEMVDFAGTDSGLWATERQTVSRGAIQVPVTAGIVVLAYNPDGLPAELNMSRTVFADIFLGQGVNQTQPVCPNVRLAVLRDAIDLGQCLCRG